jgi:hypothetical protein
MTDDDDDGDDDDGYLVELVRPADSDGLLELLNQLATVMLDGSNEKQPPPEAVQLSSRAKPPLAPLVFNLFSIMAKHWHCARTCRGSHQAALALFTNRTVSVSDETAASFSLLLSRPMPPPTSGTHWKEACITIRESLFVNPDKFTAVLQLLTSPRPEAPVHIALPGSTPRIGTRVPDLCATLRDSTRGLRLSVDGVSLYRSVGESQAQAQMKSFERCKPVSFAKGFLENDAELSFEGKICLAAVLSYAFLDFCGKPWFPGGWTKDNLYLMQDAESLFLRPFLVTDVLSGKDKPRTETNREVLSTKLLHHGILLLEIFQQDALRGPCSGQGKPAAPLKPRAQEWFASTEWDVFERYRDAADACINGDLIADLDDSSTPDANRAYDLEEQFARLFCEKVVAPLEADFCSQYRNEDPDRIMATLKLPAILKAKKEKITWLKPFSTIGTRHGAARPQTRSKLSPQPSGACPPRKPSPSFSLRQPWLTRGPSLLRSSSPVSETDEGTFFDSSGSLETAE